MYEHLDRRYALALYEVAEKKGKVQQYMDQLREIADLTKNNSDILQVLKHPEISTSKKKSTFIKLFQGKIDEEILSFLIILIEKDRILYLQEKINEMEKIHLEKNNTLIADVKTVIPLSQGQRNVLLNKLEKQYNKTIRLNEEIDPSIIGGVFIRVGSDILDGTIKSKIMEMKELIIRGE